MSKGRLRRRDIQRLGRGVHRWIGPDGQKGTPAHAAQTKDPPLARPTAEVVQAAHLSDAQPYTWTRPLDMEEMRQLDHLLRLRESVVLSHVTGPLRTWMDMASVLTRLELIAFGDHLVRCAMRRDGAEGGADSPKETQLRLALVEAGLPDPGLQIIVVDPGFHPKHPASADLGCRRQLIAIHYDGKHHRRDRQLTGNVVVTARDADTAYARVIREVRRLWPNP